ncbi:MAG: hypothetical protein KME67_12835 [Candidatus Thiodiazotropha sp. (ex Codakia orbicularis)]|nr:hypothetical protein [Candidatus Thiodiazotropha sp. (ex Lucina pensylvanica)]MBT3043737.1 hypothetical protein [Candidatus Thiodiazotropha sp. (ex Codakia orbicularis)]MBT3051533.1 hypothetical protein [Candidatus Thiodiazotropha sp. (ex Codakia orbicularis)]
MKKSFLLLSLFSLVSCSSQYQKPAQIKSQPESMVIHTNHENGVASIISNEALESFNTKYAKASKNKAFAQSLSGAWNWRSNRTSIEHAKTSALIACQRHNKKSEYIYPCKIIHINDAWVD